MNKKFAWLALTGVLTLASCGQNTTTDPTCTNGQVLQNGACVTPGATTGVLNITNPNGYTVVVKNASGTVVDSKTYGTLTPGTYTATFSMDGFTSQNVGFSITAGGTTTIVAPTLVKVVTTTPAKAGAYYVNAKGELVAITSVNPANFRFSAWMEDVRDAGFNPTTFAGTPTAAEQDEVAPLNRQNILGAYMAYTPDNGTTWFPVVGADVRWDLITEQTTGGVRFSAADDGAMDSGAMRPLDINANATSALTWTNRQSNNNVAYPASATYPTYNLTGVNSPDVNGYTWTALNHDPAATAAHARIRVVGYVNGQEIEKQWLTKDFAPSANLTITKVNTNPTDAAPNEARTFTITVRNTGQGPATGIRLNDVLKTGSAANYSVTGVPGTANAQDGFDTTFDLAAGQSRDFTFTARASDVGQYCDVASISTYNNGPFGQVTPGTTPGQAALSAQACMTVRAPKLTIIKDIVDASGNVLADANVAVNTDVRVRITVVNNGDAPAQGVQVTDRLRDGAAANYSIGAVTPATGVTMQGDDGFTTAAQNIAPGASAVYTFPARASVDGRYCDVASFTSSNAGAGSDDACFTVATARLAITKTNTPNTNLRPGAQFTSTIVVTNSGNATATGVNVNDVIQNSGVATQFFQSGTYTVTGTAQQGSVSYDATTRTANIVPNTVNIPAGGNLTLTVTSSVPAGVAPGEYCDVAAYTSSNALPATGTARACITVATSLSEHIQSSDTVDPIRIGDANSTSIVTFTSENERTSNENTTANTWLFNYGTLDPANYNGANGIFNFSNVQVWYDAAPTRNEQTGIITSDYTHGQNVTTQATINPGTGTGKLNVTVPFEMVPGSVVYIRSQISAPATAVNNQSYQSVGRWENTGKISGIRKINQAAESTTTVQ